MRFKLPLMICLFFLITYGQAKEITQESAKKAAANFLLEMQNIPLSETDNMSCITVIDDDIKVMYIYNLPENEGFVMLSAQDNTYPILGYSSQGSFVVDDPNYPPQFKDMLESFREQIVEAVANNLDPDNQIKDSWNHYISDDFQVTKAPTTVDPLLQSTWNQGCYYNGMCPEHVSGPCGRVYAGCVATAMGQVMKYYSHPTTGNGSHSYNHSEFGTLSVNFGNANYNFDEMPLSINSDNSEIAQLLYHLGVSVDMNYGYDGSGAFAGDARNAFVSYFDYSNDASLRYRSNYSNDQWEALLREQIDNGFPLCYYGYGSGGHAFNCDGYAADDYFHFNWGWSGYYDGYYYLDNLNPAGHNYSESQSAIFNVYPNNYNPLSVPENLQANVVANDVNLSWNTPTIDNQLYRHNGEYGSQAGYNGPGDFDVAARFTSEILQQYNGCELTVVHIWPAEENCEYSIRVWTGMNGANMLIDQLIPAEDLVIDQWNQITLTTPLVVDGSEDLYIGYRCNTQEGYPAGEDTGPANNGYGDLMNEGSGWLSVSNAYGIDRNWLITGIVESSVGDKSGITPVVIAANASVKEKFIRDNRVISSLNNKQFVCDPEETTKVVMNGDKGFMGYNVYRNGVKINSNLVQTNEYDDLGLQIGSYNYYVTAVYSDGESDASNEVSVVIDEVETDLVLVEIATGTWCSYCPGAAMGADDLIANGHPVAIIESHGYDSYANVYSNTRNSYYSVSGFPTANFNGATSLEGGNANNSLYSSYLPYVEAQSVITRPYDLEINGNYASGECNIQLTVQEVEEFDGNQVFVHLCLTESNIQEQWFGLDHVNFVNRLMLPTAQGTQINLSAGESSVLDYSFTLENEWMDENCELVAFVQDNSTKEVLKTIKLSLTDLPSPANDHFVTIWEGNPYQPMTVIVDDAKLDDLDLTIGDEIGVFDVNGDGVEICVGFGILESTITASNPLSIICSTDDPSTTEQDGFINGHGLIYRYWINSEGVEQEPVNATYNQAFDQVFTSLGTSIVSLNAYSYVEQNIALSTGWNIASFYVAPDNLSMENIFGPLIVSEELVKVIDEAGGFMQDIPGVGWMNTIGDMSNQEGYYIKVNGNTNLVTEGIAVELPFNVGLNTGWNIISYPIGEEQDAMAILNDLINEGALIKVINESGGFIQNIPGVGWMNTIGNFVPGEGYYVKVSSNTSLTFQNATGAKYEGMIEAVLPCSYYSPKQFANYYFPMHFVINETTVNGISEGDEIAVFDGENCVGASHYNGHGPIVIIAGKEEEGYTDSGYRQDAEFSIRFFDHESNSEYVLNLDSSSEQKFSALETWSGKAIGQNIINSSPIAMGQPVPNPCTNENLINFDLFSNGEVQLDLLNSYGQVIVNVMNCKLQKGKYQNQINVGDLNSGVYYYRLVFSNKTDKLSVVRKVIIM